MGKLGKKQYAQFRGEKGELAAEWRKLSEGEFSILTYSRELTK